MFKNNYFIFGLIALIASSPLAIMLATNTNNDTSFIAHTLLYLSPIFIGLISSFWLLVINKKLQKLWLFSPALSGGIIGLLTFITYAFAYSLLAMLLHQSEFSSSFHAIGGVGLLLFGWIPLLFGAFSGWLCYKLNA